MAISVIKTYSLIALCLVTLMLLPSCSIPPGVMDQMDSFVSDQVGDEECPTLRDVFTLSDEEAIMFDDMGFFSAVYLEIDSYLSRNTADVFNSIANDTGYRTFLAALMTLTVVIYTFAVLMGVTKATGFGVVLVFMKILLVYYFATDFTLFNTVVRDMVEYDFIIPVSAFFASAFQLELTSTVAGSGQANVVAGFNNFGLFSGQPFAVVDEVFSIFFSVQSMQLLLAMATTGFAGPIYAVLFLGVLITYVVVLAKVFYAVIVALVARSLLYAIAPFFIIFALFGNTRQFFDGWTRQILAFSLQPIFIFVIVGFFHGIVVGFFNFTIENYKTKICYRECMQAVQIPLNCYTFNTSPGDVPITPAMQSSPTASNISDGPNPDIPLHMFGILSLIIILVVLHQMVTWAENVASRLAGGFISSLGLPLFTRQQKQQFTDASASTFNAVRRKTAADKAAGAGRGQIT